MKRSAQKSNASPYGLAAGQARNGLIDHGLEYRSGKIGLSRSLVNQGLDIRFGKNSAAGGNRIYFLIIFSIGVEPLSVRLH